MCIRKPNGCGPLDTLVGGDFLGPLDALSGGVLPGPLDAPNVEDFLGSWIAWEGPYPPGNPPLRDEASPHPLQPWELCCVQLLPGGLYYPGAPQTDRQTNRQIGSQGVLRSYLQRLSDAGSVLAVSSRTSPH